MSNTAELSTKSNIEIDNENCLYVLEHLTDLMWAGGMIASISDVASSVFELSSEQLAAYVQALKDNNKLQDLVHDLAGLAAHDKHFVYRIHGLAQVA